MIGFQGTGHLPGMVSRPDTPHYVKQIVLNYFTTSHWNPVLKAPPHHLLLPSLIYDYTFLVIFTCKNKEKQLVNYLTPSFGIKP